MELITLHGMSSANRPLKPLIHAKDDPHVFPKNVEASCGARRSSRVLGMLKSGFLSLRTKSMIHPVRISVMEVRQAMKRRKPMYVLGTGLSHDGSACLLRDGAICVAIEKERITRRKHDGGNDKQAIQYCLEAAGIRPKDLSLIVQNANFGMFEWGYSWYEGPRELDPSVPVVTISHHLAHAYSAIGTSPFEETAILVIDGCGNSYDECLDLDSGVIRGTPPRGLSHLSFEKDSYHLFTKGRLRTVFKDFSPWGFHQKQYPMHPNTTLHSIGGLYLAASVYVFNGFEDPGKLMGLAPYGRPGIFDFKIFRCTGGRVFVEYDWMKKFLEPCRNTDQFERHFQHYADIAYWVQREVERAILYIVNDRYKRAPNANLCYAGGVALNAVANGRIRAETKFENVYIQPAAGDNGLAVGCAYYGWLKTLGGPRILHDQSVYLGAAYDETRMERVLRRHENQLSWKKPSDLMERTAELLAEGNVIAWFQDRAEFGPRALGNRSILADPRRSELRNYINRDIKLREDFRPFAPSVIAEETSRYFDCDFPSPHMLFVAPVRHNWARKIAAVVHHDGSARFHSVTKSSNERFYRLLAAFKNVTGLGILLNTSFNRRRMPIVETPEEAIDLFLDSGLHALVLGPYLVTKKARHKPALLRLLDASGVSEPATRLRITDWFEKFQKAQRSRK
jgi:carbamoyltransferase